MVEDGDECNGGGQSTCSADVVCENTYGGHSCLTECETDASCPSRASCKTVGDKKGCACESGFTGTEVCADYNECTTSGFGSDSCDQRCFNSLGSFSCQCTELNRDGSEGWILDGSDGHTCLDIDEVRFLTRRTPSVQSGWFIFVGGAVCDPGGL